MNFHELRARLLADTGDNAERVLTIPPTALPDLGFGAATSLPRRLHAPARVIFPDTAPLDGERGVTVLATLNAEGEAIELTLRPEQM